MIPALYGILWICHACPKTVEAMDGREGWRRPTVRLSEERGVTISSSLDDRISKKSARHTAREFKRKYHLETYIVPALIKKIKLLHTIRMLNEWIVWAHYRGSLRLSSVFGSILPSHNPFTVYSGSFLYILCSLPALSASALPFRVYIVPAALASFVLSLLKHSLICRSYSLLDCTSRIVSPGVGYGSSA